MSDTQNRDRDESESALERWFIKHPRAAKATATTIPLVLMIVPVWLELSDGSFDMSFLLGTMAGISIAWSVSVYFRFGGEASA